MAKQRSKPNAISMVALEGGTFRMGSEAFYPEEGPCRDVTVGAFEIDVFPVTYSEYRRFVEATGYVSDAEKAADPTRFPGADLTLLLPGAAVFTPTDGPVALNNHFQWWQFTPGASWRYPLGKGKSLKGIAKHPVTQVSFNDAMAYAKWVGKDLPTEAEWEFAARGGLEGREFAWGDELHPGGQRLAKTWQGEFPWRNDAPPGLERTAPVGSYPSNGFGLYDMIGNVWEWTKDPYHLLEKPAKTCCSSSQKADDPATNLKVLKGGSHLCAPEYCQRYRPASRHPQPIDEAASHIGFRCIKR
nr:Serine/threonine-protein kinase pkn1 [Virgibacillus halodenitrificans]